MRVCFAHFGQENLGIQYLSTALKKRGHDVGLAFQRLSIGDIASAELVAEKILAFQPSIAAFTVFSQTLQLCILTARIVKKAMPEIRVVFGGIHPTIATEETANIPEVDVVFHGEALKSFPDWVDCISKGETYNDMLGIAYRDNGGHIRINKRQMFVLDYTDIGLPDKELFSAFDKHFFTSYIVMAGFGCAYKCTYCEHDSFKDADGEIRIRMRPVEHVIAELEKYRHKIKFVFFTDELFGTKVSWLEKFSAEYPKRVGIPFSANLHPALVNERRLALLKAAGCEIINMGVQTASDYIRQKIYLRPEKSENILLAAQLISSFGLKFRVDRIIGNPLETDDDLYDAVIFFKKLSPRRVTVYWLTLYPKLPIKKIFEEAGVAIPAVKDSLDNKDDGAAFGGLVPTDIVYFRRWIPYAVLHVLSPILPMPVLRVFWQFTGSFRKPSCHSMRPMR